MNAELNVLTVMVGASLVFLMTLLIAGLLLARRSVRRQDDAAKMEEWATYRDALKKATGEDDDL